MIALEHNNWIAGLHYVTGLAYRDTLPYLSGDTMYTRTRKV